MTKDSCKLAVETNCYGKLSKSGRLEKEYGPSKNVYDLVKKYPKEELYALTQQTKRAVVSISSNIAEGIGRNYKKDTIQFLHISRGSLYELETLLLIAHSLGFINEVGVEF
jgi:four helix bundle protein